MLFVSLIARCSFSNTLPAHDKGKDSVSSEQYKETGHLILSSCFFSNAATISQESKLRPALRELVRDRNQTEMQASLMAALRPSLAPSALTLASDHRLC